MTPILLCHNSISVSALRPFANVVDFTSFDSRIKIWPSLRPREMSQLSFSMRQPSWLNRTYIPYSTIWPTKTKFFVMVGTWKLFYASLLAFFPKWDIADMPNGVSSIISSLDIAKSIQISKVSEPFLMRHHMVRGTGVCKPYVFRIGGTSRSRG